MNDSIDIMFGKKLIQQVIVEKKHDASKFIENSDRFYSTVENRIQSK